MAAPSAADPGPEVVPVPLTSEERAYLFDFFDEHQVDSAVATRLVDDLVSGAALWDSLNPDVEPDETIERRIGADVQRTDVYPDGSIVVSTMPAFETPDPAAPPARAVKDCTHSSSNYAAYWKNCRADENWGIYRMYFYFDYENVRERGAAITAYRHGGGHAVGYTLKDYKFTKQSNTVVRYTASAYLLTTVNFVTWIQAHVSGSNSWTTYQ